jgi:hypothetical protein
MISTHAANSTRLVALVAAFVVTAVEWASFSGIFQLVGPPRAASVQVADTSLDGALAQVVVRARHVADGPTT